MKFKYYYNDKPKHCCTCNKIILGINTHCCKCNIEYIEGMIHCCECITTLDGQSLVCHKCGNFVCGYYYKKCKVCNLGMHDCKK